MGKKVDKALIKGFIFFYLSSIVECMTFPPSLKKPPFLDRVFANSTIFHKYYFFFFFFLRNMGNETA